MSEKEQIVYEKRYMLKRRKRKHNRELIRDKMSHIVYKKK